MKPNEVNTKNSHLVLNKLMSHKTKSNAPKFKVGDTVRISKFKHVFSRGYHPSWTGEVFKVHEVKDTKPVTYILKDENDELIKGGFYEPELLKTKYPGVYLVEKVIRKKGDQLSFKWLGYPTSYNSWINAKDVAT